MSYYKRFLSYIYAYDGESKLNGMGFAKMEIRDEHYRLAVSLNAALPIDGKGYRCGIYSVGERSLRLVLIGSPEFRNGSFVLRSMGDAKDFCNGKININEASGLVICSEAERRLYLTSWSDNTVLVKDIRECIHRLKGGFSEITFENNDEVKESDDSIIFLDSDEVNMIGQDILDEPQTAVIGQDILTEPKTVEQGHEVLDEPQTAVIGQDILAEPKTVEQGHKVLDEPQTKEGEMNAFVNQSAAETFSKYENNKIYNADLPDIEGEIKEKQLKAAGMGELWHEFKRMYPKLRPFADGGWEVLQIKVQDIGRLSRENWILGNNNFVLHGFYRYGYLILARKHKQNADIYILGVPGIFTINDRFMATMFGMTDFMEADNKRPDLPKNFGYWCTRIEM